MNDDNNTDGAVGCLLSFPLWVLEGWVFSWLWYWFVVPFGIKPIGLWWAVGICMTVGVLVSTNCSYPKERISPTLLTLGCAVVWLVAWGFGAIVHSLM